MKKEILELEKLPIEVLPELRLLSGSHNSRAEGLCVMEAAAWLAGQPHSDAPPCVCGSLRDFLMKWNDGLPSDDDRTRLLVPLIPLIVGTNHSAALELRRRQEIWKWTLTESTPAWLEASGLHKEADALRADPSEANIFAARDSADAAWTAAWTAATASATAAAWDAAWDAATAAAWTAARTAAWDAAWTAARTAAWAAGSSAKEKLAPTVTKLQLSAVELVKRLAAMKP